MNFKNSKLWLVAYVSAGLSIALVLSPLTNAVLGNFVVYAATEQKPKEKQQTKTDNLTQLLQEQYKNELHLMLPDIIDDPAYSIVFKNPSKKPVTIIVDGKTYKNAKSPFVLPNLSIGVHDITFKYVNKEGIKRTLKLKVTVAPKPPVIDPQNPTLFYRPNPIVVKGNAIAGTKLLIIINSKTIETVPVQTDGSWEFILKKPTVGINNLAIFSTKYGIISKKPALISINYKLGKTNTSVQQTTAQDTSLIGRIKAKLQQHKNQLLIIGAVTLGGISVLIIWKAYKAYMARKEQEELLELLASTKKNQDPDQVLEQARKVTKQAKPQDANQDTKSKAKTKKVQARKKTKSKPRTSKNTSTTKSTSAKPTKTQQKTQQKGKKILTKTEFLEMFGKSQDQSEDNKAS